MIKLIGSQLINQLSYFYCVFFIVDEAAQMMSDDSLIDIRGENETNTYQGNDYLQFKVSPQIITEVSYHLSLTKHNI